MKTSTKAWIGLMALAALSPLGILLPARFKAGAAWGEWGGEEIQKLVGYIPHGLDRLSRMWSAPLPDYAVKGWEEKGLKHLSLAYILSALIGIALVAGAALLIGKMLTKKSER
ncbi:MAG: PDGLE domain-containing protein [Candidatus Omnitrophota bacterium]